MNATIHSIQLPDSRQPDNVNNSSDWYVEDVSHLIQSQYCFVLRSPDGQPQWFGRTEAEAWFYLPADATRSEVQNG